MHDFTRQLQGKTIPVLLMETGQLADVEHRNLIVVDGKILAINYPASRVCTGWFGRDRHHEAIMEETEGHCTCGLPLARQTAATHRDVGRAAVASGRWDP